MEDTSMKRTALTLLLLCAVGALALAETALTGEQILRKVDANENAKTLTYSGTMEITIGGEVRTKTMKAQSLGSSKAYVEFVNPEDSGVKYLKIDKNLWMYFPDQQETVKISGHLLKEGMMGSDVSYEDALESHSLYDEYAISLSGEETIDGRNCWIVKLEAKLKTAPYEVRKEWIDQERFVTLSEEMYAKSGKLLKTMHALEVKRIGERWYPTKVEMVNKLRKDTKTVFTMTDVVLDSKLSDGVFTLKNLER
jgi:outer membrane lipoprotein-sorting protein